MRAALRVLFIASVTTRNWTLNDEISRKQINDLWEAIHEIPDLLRRWNSPLACEAELLMYLREYDSKWKSPNLEEVYKQALNN
jgi:hypothetical protein